MIDSCEPFAPQPAPFFEIRQKNKNAKQRDDYGYICAIDKRVTRYKKILSLFLPLVFPLSFLFVIVVHHRHVVSAVFHSWLHVFASIAVDRVEE